MVENTHQTRRRPNRRLNFALGRFNKALLVETWRCASRSALVGRSASLRSAATTIAWPRHENARVCQFAGMTSSALPGIRWVLHGADWGTGLTRRSSRPLWAAPDFRGRRQPLNPAPPKAAA